MFQSAPLTEARGDIREDVDSTEEISLFQSAPLTEARGDLDGGYVKPATKVVSIRSPDRSQGRFPRPPPNPIGPIGFNPLP